MLPRESLAASMFGSADLALPCRHYYSTLDD